MSLKKDLGDMNEEVRSACGSFLLGLVGGQGAGPQLQRVERTEPAEFEADRKRLCEATGKDHFLAEEDVQGKLIGKVELGDNMWGRVSQKDGRIALVPWEKEMTDLLGMEVSVNREQGKTVMQAVEKGGVEREI